MKKRELTDEYFTLWVLIAQTKDALLKARQREYLRFNITNERRAVLWAIENLGGKASPIEIARLLFREPNSISEMIKRMAKERLIKKYKNPHKQGMTIELTQKGYEVLDQSRCNVTDKRILSVLTKKQRERISSYLIEIRKRALREFGIPEWATQFPITDSDCLSGSDSE